MFTMGIATVDEKKGGTVGICLTFEAILVVNCTRSHRMRNAAFRCLWEYIAQYQQQLDSITKVEKMNVIKQQKQQ